MKDNRKNKGQEEIVGFVVIVVIVAIIGVIFLGFSLNKKQTPQVTSNSEIRQFLESALEYTGNCSIGSEGNDRKLARTLVECGTNPLSLCLSGESTCSNLNNTFKEMLNMDNTYKIKKDSKYKGYILNTRLIDTINRTILNITAGNCTGNYKADEIPYNTYNPNSKMRISLKICS